MQRRAGGRSRKEFHPEREGTPRASAVRRTRARIGDVLVRRAEIHADRPEIERAGGIEPVAPGDGEGGVVPLVRDPEIPASGTDDRVRGSEFEETGARPGRQQLAQERRSRRSRVGPSAVDREQA